MYEQQYSGPMTAWVVVHENPNEDGELVELVEVDASRIPASKQHRSQYEWFANDHWAHLADECFWDADNRPEPGEYLVRFHIEGGWTNNSNGCDYDEELVVDKIEKVDLGAIPVISALRAGSGLFVDRARESDEQGEGHALE